jgi:hypothetical protein
MDETFLKIIEDKKLHYGDYTRQLIDLITRVQSKVDLEAKKVFGKHIHAFSWAFFTGLNENKKEIPNSWKYTDTFSLGTFYRDGAETVANVMLMSALNEYEILDIEEDFTKDKNIRTLLNIISSYAEGGAKHILEIREGNDLESKTYLNNIDDFFDVINSRI